jgi:ABC-type dipeptide/oligopeptide/nickel transport system ATPase component
MLTLWLGINDPKKPHGSVRLRALGGMRQAVMISMALACERIS